ncbi:hypothetical protein SFHH103_06145 (plasmid) [Sinorhizobium fredii HH103]|uniref:PAC domain-containing protein n=2 Tax=Rhizobium fredii TaxID=380 RepID=G9AHS3_SINF1|nr:hypothetical protein SFHH103_06145 [Sinorhizobium fredii HH103]
MEAGKIAASAVAVAAVSLVMTLFYQGSGSEIAALGLIMTGVKFIATLSAASVIAYFHAFTVERDILRAALTQAPDFHYVKNNKSEFVVTNLNVAHHHGRTKSSEMVGLTDFDLFPSEMAQAFFDREQAIMSTGEPMVDLEERFLEEDGRERWFLTSKVPLRNRRGVLIGLAGVTRDVRKSAWCRTPSTAGTCCRKP